jgi:glutamate-ammonia-ligase adenylyltransferase
VSSYPAGPARRSTLAGRLARMGFTDAARAGEVVAALGLGDELAAVFGSAADPDLALTGLARLLEADGTGPPGLRSVLRDDPPFATRLAAVLGASAALADHLARHPADWTVLRGPRALHRPDAAELRVTMLNAVGASPDAAEPVANEAGPAPLALAYRRALLHLAARDLTGVMTLEDTAAELADLAAAVLEAALALARAQLPADAAPARLAVIAMGKCGGHELNYASDVDVIFVAEAPEGADDESAALRTATRLASGLIQACSQPTSEGAIFPVDPNLRPEGRDGPLVRTLASHRAYYGRWAKTWEFQALLKARPVAGDAALGEDYMAAIAPLVWQAAQRDNFVEDVQAMRRRVERSVPADQAGRQLKLGPGGLRDIEFTVQLLQLVHGRLDEALRSPATLPALAALAAGGYVGRDDAAELADAYRFLRRVEHLLQLYQLRRTHVLPDDPQTVRRIGRAMFSSFLPYGSLPPPVRPADPAAEFTAQWRRHAIEVRRLHEKLFYRPLLQAAARLPGEAASLSPAAARARLEALGYVDPAGALRHIEALTAGVSRRAAIQRTLLPVLLDWFAGAAEPDAGLLAFRQVSDELGNTHWYLRLLRDDTRVAQRLALLLASSRYATGLLLRAPAAVAMLADDAELAPRPYGTLAAEAAAVARRHGAAEDAVAAIRAIRRRELLRVAAADLLGLIGPDQVRQALTSVVAVTVESALAVATRKVELELRAPLPTRMCVVAMGRFGGHESGYASDADVMFVHDPLPDASGSLGSAGSAGEAASRAAHHVAEELRRLLSLPAPDPPLVIDPDLRPEGRQGPLVRTLASYQAYYRRWSGSWEAQALLRAEPVAGDPALGLAFIAMADEFRYPEGGIDPAATTQIRRLKARMEAERIPRGTEPALHLKLGPGGLSDVEWVVQLLQLRHAFAAPGLRTTRTLDALTAAVTAGLLAADDGETLATAWRLAARVRDAIMLVRGKSSDVLPTRQPELAAVARILGYEPGDSSALVEDYRRAARRARHVMERVFYD